MRILFPILILAGSGCGTMTALSVAQKDPKVEPIYGGVRTDINCIFGIKTTDEHYYWAEGPVVDWIAKPCSIVDLPLSLVADTLVLPYAIVWTIKHRPYSWRPEEGDEAGDSEHVPAAQTTQSTVAEPTQSPTLAPGPMEKAK